MNRAQRISVKPPEIHPTGALGANPYKAESGEHLDGLLNAAYFDGAPEPQSYSTDPIAAKTLLAKIEAVYKRRVITGQTKTRPPLHFARLETDPSTSTETMADTCPLAIARLGLVLAERRSSR